MEEPSRRSEAPIWARPVRERRQSSLTRQAVVDAAMRIADAEGLAAVSIRRVAADLGARTMSLYSHIDSKDDLLDLMAEQAAAETIIEGDLPPDWRAAVLLIARREREVALRHPWLTELIGRPGTIGPNGLRHLEQSLRALTPLTPDPTEALRTLIAITEYVRGHVIGAIHRPTAGVLTHPYIRALLDTGDFPTLAPLISTPPDLGDPFERGLTWLLNGIEAAHHP